MNADIEGPLMEPEGSGARDLAGLIARLEGAGGPDRELDARVWCAIAGFTFVGLTKDKIGYFRFPEDDRNTQFAHNGMRFTSSLDAALTLLPNGAWFSVSGPHGVKFDAITIDTSTDSQGATAALAVCITALKARLAEQTRPKAREVQGDSP